MGENILISSIERCLRPGKTRQHVSRNTRSARMFPKCFPVLPHEKHCFQRQFCFQEAKFASATWQKHFVFPRGMETWQNEETITETCFWKHVSSFCQAFTHGFSTERGFVTKSRNTPKFCISRMKLLSHYSLYYTF